VQILFYRISRLPDPLIAFLLFTGCNCSINNEQLRVKIAKNQ
jgi:hypothetical protein